MKQDEWTPPNSVAWASIRQVAQKMSASRKDRWSHSAHHPIQLSKSSFDEPIGTSKASFWKRNRASVRPDQEEENSSNWCGVLLRNSIWEAVLNRSLIERVSRSPILQIIPIIRTFEVRTSPLIWMLVSLIYQVKIGRIDLRFDRFCYFLSILYHFFFNLPFPSSAGIVIISLKKAPEITLFDQLG